MLKLTLMTNKKKKTAGDLFRQSSFVFMLYFSVH